MSTNKTTAKRNGAPRLQTPTDLGANASKDIAGAMNAILADTFVLYMKTKNFHWHVSGPHFRDYHLLLDEQADQLFATTDVIAERVRKIGKPTLRSIGDIARKQRLADNDADYVTPDDMLAELREDNQRVVASMREAHGLCDEHEDVATASLLGDLHRRRRKAGLVPVRSQPPRRPRRALAGHSTQVPLNAVAALRPSRDRFGECERSEARKASFGGSRKPATTTAGLSRSRS